MPTALTTPLSRSVRMLFIAVVLLTVTQLIGQAGTNLVQWLWAGSGLGPYWLAAILGIAFVMAALGSLGLGDRYARPSAWVIGIRAILIVVTIIASNTLFTQLQAGAEWILGGSWSLTLLATTVLLGVWGWASLVKMPELQQWFHAPVAKTTSASRGVPAGPLVLVTIVSKIGDGSLEFDDLNGGATVVFDKQGDKTGRRRQVDSTSLAAGIESLNDETKWPWQQLLRGIKPVAERPGADAALTIVLVGSSGPTGSFRQLPDLIRFMRLFPELAEMRHVHITRMRTDRCPRCLRFFCDPGCPDRGGDNGVNFEDYNQILRLVRETVFDACDLVGDDHVLVDVTGGQKPTSLAAAVATIGEKGIVQYVQTDPTLVEQNEEKIHVEFYDLHPPERPG